MDVRVGGGAHRRRDDLVVPRQGQPPSDSGRRESGDRIVLDGATGGYGLFGPYISLAPGKWLLRIYFDTTVVKSGRVLIDVSSDQGTARIAALKVNLADVKGGVLELRMPLRRHASAVEARLLCRGPVSGAITAIDFHCEGVAV